MFKLADRYDHSRSGLRAHYHAALRLPWTGVEERPVRRRPGRADRQPRKASGTSKTFAARQAISGAGRGVPDARNAGAVTSLSPTPSPPPGAFPPMRTQRWTLAVVSAATAMLMLDIAVVNTALSDIAMDLNTGLSGLQWVVDAYTLALAAIVLTAGSLADRLGRRRLFLIGLGIFTATSLGCRRRRHHVLNTPRRAGHRRRDHVRHLAGAARERLSRRARARRRARRLRRDDRRRLRRRPARRRRAHQRPRLALDLPRQHPDRPRAASSRRARTCRSRATPPPTASTGPARSPSPAACSCSCSRCCAATTTAGRAPILGELAGATALIAAFVAVERASRSRCCRCACSGSRRSPARRSRPSRSRRRSSRSSSTRRSTCSRSLGLSAIEAGLVYLPATITMLFVSGATARWAAAHRAADGRRRARARRRRHGPVHARRRRLGVDDRPARRIVALIGTGCSTRR